MSLLRMGRRPLQELHVIGHAPVASCLCWSRFLGCTMKSKAIPCRWARHEDEMLRELVDAGAPLEFICETLNRTEQELRRRGYDIGLPMKWFKRSAA
jgi:hypothetical protein